MNFTPPFPERPATRLPLLETLRRFRRSQISVWLAGHFSADFFASKILARRIFVCNSPETVHAAFVQNPEALERKTPQMRHALEPLLGDGLFISDGLVWKQRRRVVAPVTHISRLAELTPVMTECAAERAAAWRALPDGAPLDALAEMAHLTAEIICRALFGRDLGAESAREVTEAFTRYQALVGQTNLPAMFGLPAWWPQGPNLRLRRQVRRIHAVVDRLIGAILEGGGESSLIGAMAQARLPDGSRLGREAFRNEAATLFMAGHETTANTLAWAWFLLSQHPPSAARVRAEARAVLGGRAATFEDLPNLPFTQAVIEETLRLYPPVPILGREAQDDFTLAGRAVPKGSLVLVVPWLLHRHEKYWPEPDRFLPERFLPEAPPPPRHAYIPFSLGARICTGMQFGLAETVISLATLAQEFHLRLEPGTQVMPVCRLTLRPGETLPMRLERPA